VVPKKRKQNFPTYVWVLLIALHKDEKVDAKIFGIETNEIFQSSFISN